MTDPAERKKLLRRAANAGGDLSGDRARLDAAMCARFIEAFPPDPSKALSFFWPLARECDTRPIAMACVAAGMVCALPVVVERQSLREGLTFRRWDMDARLMRSPLGTMEPVADHPAVVPDLMLVPLVMADLRGTRLGRGRGYYDATLAALRARKADLLAIGVAYDWQVSEDPLPCEPHDQRLDGLLTPTRCLLFG